MRHAVVAFLALLLLGSCSTEPTAPPLATRLAVIAQPPASVTAGQVIAPAIQVATQDATGNTVTTGTRIVTLALTSGSGTAGASLGGSLQRPVVNGIATFADITVDKAGAGYTLTATVTTGDALTPATTSAFAVTAGAPSRLAIITQPASGTAFESLSAVTVAVEDAHGNAATTPVSVTVAITSGTGADGATLSGTTTKTSANGVATFDDLTIDRGGSGYTLTASATGLTSAVSTAFNVAPGGPSRLAFSVQPASAARGATIGAPVVVVTDAGGNVLTTATNSITIALGTNPGGGTLSGTTVRSAASGQATFSDLSVDAAGSGYTLVASSTGLTSATSAPFDVAAYGAATALAFTTQPSNAVAGENIAPAVQVAVRDATGNTVANSTAQVTLSLASGPTGGTLRGTVTANAVDGIATFNAINDTVAGTYTLSASATGLTSATSSSYTISAASAARLAFVTQPGATVAGAAFQNTVQVRITDAYHNPVSSATNPVTIAIAGVVPVTNDPTAPLRFTRSGTVSTPIEPLAGTLTVAAVSGVASFPDLRPRTSGDYDVANNARPWLQATAAGLTTATSDPFVVTPAGATQVWVSVPPCTTSGCVPPFPPMAVQATHQAFAVAAYLLDSLNNRTDAGTNTVSLAMAANPGGAVLTTESSVAAVNGRANFTASLDKPGTGYTITATSSGLTGTASYPFDVVQQWAVKDSLPEARNAMFAGESGGKIYVVAGSQGFPNFLASTRAYDPATNSWSDLASAGVARAFSATNSAVVNGVLHVVAGNPSGTCTTANEAYTVSTNTWSGKTAAPRERCHAAAVAHNGLVYVVGGWNSSSTTRYAEMDVYNPATNTWSAGTPLPSGEFRGGMAAAVLGGKLYLVGGTIATDDPCTNTVRVFDFGTNTWSTAANMSTDRCSPAAAVVNGRLYVAGGSGDSGTALATVESYDPGTNSWRTETSLSVARQALALVAVGNTLYAIGGSSGTVTYRIVEALTIP